MVVTILIAVMIFTIVSASVCYIKLINVTKRVDDLHCDTLTEYESLNEQVENQQEKIDKFSKRLNAMECANKLGMKLSDNGTYSLDGIYVIERNRWNLFNYGNTMIRNPYVDDGTLRGESENHKEISKEITNSIASRFRKATDDEQKEFIKEYNIHM